ncbi:hypothetical protein [Pleurocapsa sp. PCC 7319]|uniref:hypothetical protein n=1 Tax=Pleurocapsa sp. PCC 7319 TaxID=118161 RepID=UPI0003476737|nr:hypothetical protein [Pleurocapsa sp. PCC 7319]
MKTKFNPLNSLLIVFIVTSLVIFSACEDKTALLVKDSSPSIAEERIGLDGEYDASGLAKRVAKALDEDSILGGISTVYVAQNDSKIILKGTIPDKSFLDRLVTVAQNVRGVSEVNIEQVQIR